mgnify:CR=1 FL=1
MPVSMPATASKPVRTSRKPSILIVGLRERQRGLCEARLSDAASLRYLFTVGGNGRTLPQADRVYLLTRFVNHALVNHITSDLPRATIVSHRGGLPTLVARIANDLGVANGTDC